MLGALPNWIQDRLLGLLPLHTLTLVAHAIERWTEKVEMHASEPDMWRRVNATVAEISCYIIELTVTSVTMVTVTDLVEIVSEGVLSKLKCAYRREPEKILESRQFLGDPDGFLFFMLFSLFLLGEVLLLDLFGF